MFAGRLASSRAHLEEVLALCDLNSDHSFVRQAGAYPEVASQAFLAIVLVCLGYPDGALARATAAIEEARRLAHAPSLAVSLTNGRATAVVHRINLTDLEAWADQLISVTAEQGFLLWRAMGTIYRGGVGVNNSDVVEGISLLRRGLAAYRATGAGAFLRPLSNCAFGQGVRDRGSV